jgi:hypothetical protein
MFGGRGMSGNGKTDHAQIFKTLITTTPELKEKKNGHGIRG